MGNIFWPSVQASLHSGFKGIFSLQKSAAREIFPDPAIVLKLQNVLKQ